MPKSRRKTKKTILTTSTRLIEVSNEFDLPICCSNRNCPSHWHDRLTEKLKNLQQLKLKNLSTLSKQQHQLIYSDILLKLFQNETSNNTNNDIYLKPIDKTIILNKYQILHNQLLKQFNETTYIFSRINLNYQIQTRMISLRLNQINSFELIKLNHLKLNHIHLNKYLLLKILSIPIWNRLAVYVIVQDENFHCIRLVIYNWLYINETRQIKSMNYIYERLKNLLPLNSSIILINPWFKKSLDGEFTLRCESPNTHLILQDYNQQNSLNSSIDIEQLRQLGNECYQADDSLSAIQYYTFGLKQLDEQHEKELTSKGQIIGPKTDEREHNRIRFLSNRSACYLRERHAALAIAETGNLLTFNEYSSVFSSNKLTTSKLLFRCLNAHLQLGLYNRVETLLKSHKFSIGLAGNENPASMTILERELIRLKNESFYYRYDLHEMFYEQINKKTSLMFIDLSHHHAECQRNDLFEIRHCYQENYPLNSYGIYALKDIDIGTLLIVEQPFASIDKRLINNEYLQTINTWTKSLNSKKRFCSNETLRLINEIEKQLFIGNTTSITFQRIQMMQPIRKWLETNPCNENIEIDVLEGFEQLLSETKQWKPSSLIKRSLPKHIPWNILLKTEQENPYQSNIIRGWYPLGSMFNHSCLPNCIWYLIGDYLFIYVCSTNVRQGDELTISYCPLWISSIQERMNLLREYQINICHCHLCIYDRLIFDDYENELKKFINLRALTRQKNISNINRWKYFQQLKNQYEILNKKFSQRPIGFIKEFLDIQTIFNYFSKENLEKDIDHMIKIEQDSFRLHFTNLIGINNKEIFNPIILFGPQLQYFIENFEQTSKDLLGYLYEIYSFKCYSSTDDRQKQFFNYLFQTQTWIMKEKNF